MKGSDFSKGHLMMFIATLFFSFNFIMLKYMMPHWMNGYDATFFRIVGALILFWVSSCFIKNTPIEKSDRSTLFFSGLFGLFPFMVFFNLALEYSSVIDVSIIMTTPPVLVVLITALIDKEKISFQNGLGLFLSIGGAIFLILIGKTGSGTGRDMMGNLFAAVSSIAYAYYLFSLRKCSGKYSSISLLRWVFLFSVLISGAIGIWMAYNGMGVWSIVAQTLSNYLFVIVFMRLFFKWYPSFEFSKSSFQYLWSFGSKLLLTGLINSVYVNLYSFIIAKRYSVVDAGLYNRAQTLSMFPPLTISSIFVKVFYPIQCKIEDEKELVNNFFRGIRASSFIVFPIMVGLVVLAEPFVMVLLKEQWKPVVPILQILSLGYMWNPIMLLNSSILSVKGRTDLSLKAEMLKKLLGVIFLLALISFNVYIFCISFILYVFADIIVITKYVNRVIGVTLFDELKQIFPTLILSSCMGVFIYATTFFIDNNLIKLISGTLLGIVFYLGVSYLFKFKEITIFIDIIRSRIYDR